MKTYELKYVNQNNEYATMFIRAKNRKKAKFKFKNLEMIKPFINNGFLLEWKALTVVKVPTTKKNKKGLRPTGWYEKEWLYVDMTSDLKQEINAEFISLENN
jgi:hypothetical protein